MTLHRISDHADYCPTAEGRERILERTRGKIEAVTGVVNKWRNRPGNEAEENPRPSDSPLEDDDDRE